MTAFAMAKLVSLLGSCWRSRPTPLAATQWRQEPFIDGSYSHAKVGLAHQRQVLAAPESDRLFFAGEVCSRTIFSTADGAYEAGCSAAAAILA